MIYYFNPRTSAETGIPNEWKLLSGNIMDNPQFVAQLVDLINKQLYFSDLNDLARVLDQIIGVNGEVYIGGLPTAEGTWKLEVNGEDLEISRFDGNDWVVKQTIYNQQN